MKASALALLALASILGACASEPPRIHTGTLPADPPPVAPRVFDATFETPPIVAGPPPREIAFGITEKDLPLGITVADLELGATASGALLAAVALGLAGSWALNLATSGRRPRALATASEAGSPASAGAGPAGAVTLTMQRLQHVTTTPQAPASPGTEIRVAGPFSPEIRPPASAIAMLEAAVAESSPAAPATPRGPSSGTQIASGVAAAAASTRTGLVAMGRGGAQGAVAAAHGLAWASRKTGHGVQRLAYWTSIAAGGAWRAVAYAPRRAWSDFERRRSPYRAGGEFWVRGTEMLRMGVQNEAERHYWTGLYECEDRGWDIESAECRRELARIAAKRGKFDEAIGHLEAAAATFEQHSETARLEAVRSEVQQLRAVARLQLPSLDPAD